MQVFVVECREDYEPSIIAGVYESRERAEHAIDVFKASDAENLYFNTRYKTFYNELSPLPDDLKDMYERWCARINSEYIIHEFPFNQVVF